MSMPPDVNIAVVEETGPVEFERPVPWRAVLAGIVVALVVQVLLAVLGGAIGLAFVDPTRVDNPDAGTATVIAIIWWTLSSAYVFLASPQCSSYITGEILPIIGGY